MYSQRQAGLPVYTTAKFFNFSQHTCRKYNRAAGEHLPQKAQTDRHAKLRRLCLPITKTINYRTEGKKHTLAALTLRSNQINHNRVNVKNGTDIRETDIRHHSLDGCGQRKIGYKSRR